MQRSKKTSFFLAFAIMFVMAVSSGHVYGQTAARPSGLLRAKNPVPNQYIVVLKDAETKPGGSAADIPATARNMSAQFSGELGHVYKSALHGFSVRMQEAQALALAQDPRVEYVAENAMIKADAVQSPAPWGLDRIDQRSYLRDGLYHYVQTGAGVHVYVVDSGIQANHPDFGGRAASVADFVNDGQNGNDCNGHGTFVAGILGGQTYGAAKGVTIHSLRVLNCDGWGIADNAIAAADWITANKILPAVVNMSFGSIPYEPLDTAVRNSIASGITYVVSAGNENQDASNKSPARVAEAITVGATDALDNRYSLSNFGPSIDLFAPGVTITSDWIGSATRADSHTSFAAPHVAGVAALYLQTNPAASPATVRNAIVAAATKNVVTDPGAGSPNALLFVNFPIATVTIAGQEQHECKLDTDVCGGIIYDAGTVSITVGSRTYTVSYGKLSTTTAIASALANAINFDPAVTASSSGAAITLVSRTFSCYGLSTSSSSSIPDRFGPSFWGTIAGPDCP